MVVLTITDNNTSYLVELSCKATPATASMTTHMNRDVLIFGIWYQHSQLHEQLLNQI